ncbi:Predicted metal-binding protein [Rhizobium sp. RU20A]|uniref:DUF1636 family protein n=1 Tax=Rhizobium sp. RU20A TaxID=1907412 RepID=UPI000954290C|nr:DUF1636 domain-containing protein [Rhizobium sp. RU20A]SIQ96434.1 Predicted metal-binding protein [Rhizobium sp. RU20A]
MDDLLSMAVCSRCQTLPVPDAVRGTVPPDLATSYPQAPGARLLDRLAAAVADHGIRVQPTACLAGCDRPLTIGISAPGRASYLFGNIDPETDLPALMDFAALYRTAPGGWTNEGQRPLGLRGKIIARIPAPAVSEVHA